MKYFIPLLFLFCFGCSQVDKSCKDCCGGSCAQCCDGDCEQCCKSVKKSVIVKPGKIDINY